MEQSEITKDEYKILVTDDSKLSRRVITDILNSNGFTSVATAETAEEAYIKNKKENYHLHIVDLVLPETSGMELIKSLNELPSPRSIIVISSLNAESYIVDAISSGANDFLKKPFTENEISTSVERVFELAKKEKSI